MIKLEARIKLFDSNDGTVNNAQFNNNNNISWNIFTATSSFGQIVGKEVKQTKPFLLGNSPLVGGEDYEIPKTSDMYVLADRVNYFIGSLVSGKDGTFPNGASYSITINGADFNAITIIFDKDDEVWPTEITINGKSYTNDDPTFTVNGLGGVDSLDVTITQLNKPNKGLIVTGVYVDITIVVDEKNLDSFTYSLYDRENNDEPSYGVVSNSGTLSFVDSTGEILDYITNRMLTEDMAINVYVLNTLSGKEELFVRAASKTWTYDNDNFNVSVELKDPIERLQNVDIAIPYADFISLTDLLAAINAKLDTAKEKVVFDEAMYDLLRENATDPDSVVGLSNIYYDNGSLWNLLDNLCAVFYAKCYTRVTKTLPIEYYVELIVKEQ